MRRGEILSGFKSQSFRQSNNRKNNMQFRLHTFYTTSALECNLEKVLEQVPTGWSSILTSGFEEMFKAGWDGEIRQIKEKFGSLRLYLQNSNEEIETIVRRMEEQTEDICCVCGEPATKHSSGWYMH